MSLTRRIAIRVLLTGAGLLFSSGYSMMDALAKPARQRKTTASKKPGDAAQFDWHPERSPSGPLAIIVSLTKQRVYVYRNGIQIGVATCSTGKEGYETPTGVFTILQKEEEHYSKTYDDAPMPHMHRLT
jgi:lipoprotein-anchoring transpeptidase ErfK/SrfK